MGENDGARQAEFEAAKKGALRICRLPHPNEMIERGSGHAAAGDGGLGRAEGGLGGGNGLGGWRGRGESRAGGLRVGEADGVGVDDGFQPEGEVADLLRLVAEGGGADGGLEDLPQLGFGLADFILISGLDPVVGVGAGFVGGGDALEITLGGAVGGGRKLRVQRGEAEPENEEAGDERLRFHGAERRGLAGGAGGFGDAAVAPLRRALCVLSGAVAKSLGSAADFFAGAGRAPRLTERAEPGT